VDVPAHNRRAWNAQVAEGNRWTIPVEPDEIQRAREGIWNVLLTPNKPVPHSWFGSIEDCDLLCLASGGGQQAPVLAAAGIRVTSFDNSEAQLASDRFVAERDGLAIRTVQGDMADLSIFPDASFDVVFHPVSNVFVPDVKPVWKECFRVLRPGGRLLAGFMNPAFFLFDNFAIEKGGPLEVRYSLPYSDIDHFDELTQRGVMNENTPLEFGHTLDDLLGAQLASGFVITDLFEDDWNNTATPLNAYLNLFIATLARKPPL
jgi:SAM-dependent methyltransferase